jgi:hypothetical protein
MKNYRNQMITENKLNRAYMVLRTNRIECMARMITKNDLITHTTAKTAKTNAPEMIAADHPQDIAPTPRRAARAAQAITTETAHHSMMKRRNTRKKLKKNNSVDHHAPSSTTEK